MQITLVKMYHELILIWYIYGEFLKNIELYSIIIRIWTKECNQNYRRVSSQKVKFNKLSKMHTKWGIIFICLGRQ